MSGTHSVRDKTNYRTGLNEHINSKGTRIKTHCCIFSWQPSCGAMSKAFWTIFLDCSECLNILISWKLKLIWDMQSGKIRSSFGLRRTCFVSHVAEIFSSVHVSFQTLVKCWALISSLFHVMSIIEWSLSSLVCILMLENRNNSYLLLQASIRPKGNEALDEGRDLRNKQTFALKETRHK